jgi:hypothetical protein
MHTIRLPTIAFRLRNRFLLRQRFSNSSASSSARRKKKTGMSGDILYISPVVYFVSHHGYRRGWRPDESFYPENAFT